MRRAIGIGVVAALLVALLGVGIGVAAYHAGESHAVVETVARTGEVPGAVHVYGRGWGPGFGFFPFGFFLFPLLFIGTLLLIRVAFWRGRWGRWGGPGPWGPGGQWSQRGPWGSGPWGQGQAGWPGYGPGYGPAYGPGQPPAQQAETPGRAAQATGLEDDQPAGQEPAWHPEDQAGGRTARREDGPEGS